MPARTSGGRRDNQTRTPLLEFSAVADFRYSLPNVSRAAAQEGRGGARYLTNSEQFANQVAGGQSGSVPHPPYPPPPALPVAGALGGLRLQRQADAVPVAVAGAGQQRRTLIFLQAFSERHAAEAVGVFCARAAIDIFLTSDLVKAYPLWIGRRELQEWDVVVDLGQLEIRRDIEIWPVDMEGELVAALGLRPSPRYPSDARPLRRRGRLRIGVLPLASSPLRTLPPPVALALVEALAEHGEVSLCLNSNQRQGVRPSARGGAPAHRHRGRRISVDRRSAGRHRFVRLGRVRRQRPGAHGETVRHSRRRRLHLGAARGFARTLYQPRRLVGAVPRSPLPRALWPRQAAPSGRRHGRLHGPARDGVGRTVVGGRRSAPRRDRRPAAARVSAVRSGALIQAQKKKERTEVRSSPHETMGSTSESNPGADGKRRPSVFILRDVQVVVPLMAGEIADELDARAHRVGDTGSVDRKLI